MLGNYVLAAAMWNGPRAALVAFYQPPADPPRPAPTLPNDATWRDAGASTASISRGRKCATSC